MVAVYWPAFKLPIDIEALPFLIFALCVIFPITTSTLPVASLGSSILIIASSPTLISSTVTLIAGVTLPTPNA